MDVAKLPSHASNQFSKARSSEVREFRRETSSVPACSPARATRFAYAPRYCDGCWRFPRDPKASQSVKENEIVSLCLHNSMMRQKKERKKRLIDSKSMRGQTCLLDFRKEVPRMCEIIDTNKIYFARSVDIQRDMILWLLFHTFSSPFFASLAVLYNCLSAFSRWP